jgi:hypothetical protein
VLWALQVGNVIDPERQRLGEVDEVAVFFPRGARTESSASAARSPTTRILSVPSKS